MRGNGRTVESLDWTRMQRLKAIIERERERERERESKGLKPCGQSVLIAPPPTPRRVNSPHATHGGSGPTSSGGMSNTRTAAASLTSRIITHVLVFAVLRRTSSVTLVYVFPSLLRLSASCCHYVNPFPLPLGAWTTPWNQSAARGVSSASRGSG